MSANLKELINKRNKGFVALLNSNQSNFTRYSNQCFECKLKPLKPIRSYHCQTCQRDIIYQHKHSVMANNCIGIENLRYFLLFNLYQSLCLAMIVAGFIMYR